MFNLKLKSDSDLEALFCVEAVAIVCKGCEEVQLPSIDLNAKLCAIGVSRPVLGVVGAFYVCNLDYFEVSMRLHKDLFDKCSRILVFSCGAGVQQLSSFFPGKEVFPLCDTSLLQGYQGVTPSQFDCALCGDCHLNKTAAICPITSCAKSLINGACGGTKDGKCEVDNEMECGWEHINKRINMHKGASN